MQHASGCCMKATRECEGTKPNSVGIGLGWDFILFAARSILRKTAAGQESWRYFQNVSTSSAEAKFLFVLFCVWVFFCSLIRTLPSKISRDLEKSFSIQSTFIGTVDLYLFIPSAFDRV